MAEWKQLQPAIVGIVRKLPTNSYLAIRNHACLLQFAAVEGAAGPVLRAEVCRDSPEEEPRLREKGWDLVDVWSGLWRRDIPSSSGDEAVQSLVLEAITAVKVSFGVRQPDGFTYQSWQEVPPRASWQFWKSGEDKILTWPELQLPKGKDKVD